MNYLKERHMICLTLTELENLMRAFFSVQLNDELRKRNYSDFEVLSDSEKLKEITEFQKSQLLKNKEDVEIFLALYVLADFYTKGSQICFEMKSVFNPKKDKITAYKDLKKHLKESTLTDFGILCEGFLREFQMKRYMEDVLDTESLFAFLKSKVDHYGLDLGDVNLFVILQSKDRNLNKVYFEKLNEQLKDLGIKSSGEILISYNENNRLQVIYQVFPELTRSEVPIVLPSQRQR